MSPRLTSRPTPLAEAFSPKLLYVCAHRWEAEPFIQLGSLKPLATLGLPLQVYGDEAGELWLLVCGQGGLRAGAATAALLAHLSYGSETLVVANFGFAAAHQRHHSLQSLVLGNKVTDANSGDSIFPERILKTNWAEAEIVTVGKPLSEPLNDDAKALYDMEVAAILAATELFLSTSQMVVGKFVSDHLGGGLPEWSELRKKHQQAYSRACSDFFFLAQNHQRHLSSEPRRSRARTAEQWWSSQAQRLSTYLQLSVTQTREIEKTLRSLALSKAPEGSLQEVEDEISFLLDECGSVEQKHERRRALEKVRQLALHPIEFEVGP